MMPLQFSQTIPLSLYLHFPWCMQKCPYCDFNSHHKPDAIPEAAYITALLDDLDQSFPLIYGRRLQSIFMGGGTPSLFTGSTMASLLQSVYARFHYSPELEITLEANPGTIDEQHFNAYRQAGINRLSLGAQSFDDTALRRLGRIHDKQAIFRAFALARKAGFSNINLDLMFGLPEQTKAYALADLAEAIRLAPEHISWYQLTLEPNTVFYKKPPVLPNNDQLAEIHAEGLAYLAEHGYVQYEVSAFAKSGKQCRHNVNYWQFGDYLGLGAGAHSKITDVAKAEVRRYRRLTLPKNYLADNKDFIAESQSLSSQELIFEFMLNALRLQQPIPFSLFEQHTGLSRELLKPILQAAKNDGLLRYDTQQITKTPLGERFLNDLQAYFLTV